MGATLSKQDVRDFLYKVETKATHTINEKWKLKKNEAIDRYLSINPKLEKLLSSLIYHSLALEETRKDIIAKFNSNFYISNYNRVSEEYRYEFFNNYTPDDAVEVTEVQLEWNKENNNLRTEYAKIRNMIDNTKNGKKAAEVLEALGFDITSLYAPVNTKVNTEILFPCGERK